MCPSKEEVACICNVYVTSLCVPASSLRCKTCNHSRLCVRRLSGCISQPNPTSIKVGCKLCPWWCMCEVVLIFPDDRWTYEKYAHLSCWREVCRNLPTPFSVISFFNHPPSEATFTQTGVSPTLKQCKRLHWWEGVVSCTSESNKYNLESPAGETCVCLEGC